MSKSTKQLPNCLARAETKVLIAMPLFSVASVPILLSSRSMNQVPEKLFFGQ